MCSLPFKLDVPAVVANDIRTCFVNKKTLTTLSAMEQLIVKSLCQLAFNSKKSNLILEKVLKTFNSAAASGTDETQFLKETLLPVLAHSGTPTSKNDPKFTFANPAALALFGYNESEFIGLPSKLSAGPEDRSEREVMMKQAALDGYILNYNGIRVKKNGEMFWIKNGIIFNLKEGDTVIGQAAIIPTFAEIQDESKEFSFINKI